MQFKHFSNLADAAKFVTFNGPHAETYRQLYKRLDWQKIGIDLINTGKIEVHEDLENNEPLYSVFSYGMFEIELPEEEPEEDYKGLKSIEFYPLFDV